MTEIETYERLQQIARRQEEIGAACTVAQANGADIAQLIAETIALNAEELTLREALASPPWDQGETQ